jgi:glycine/D-amino acid oxidase-like deaminating enzyme
VLNVVVVGAGIVGSSVAYRLAMAGAQVIVLEADRPAAGTSSNSFAWANANEKLPRAYFDLNFAGLQEHDRLADELGSRAFEPSGNLEVAVDPVKRELLRQKVGRLSAWGYRAELIPAKRARELAPELSLSTSGEADYAYYADEGWVAVPVLIAQLLAGARRAGARMVYPARALAIECRGQQVTGVVTAGARYPAEVVVDCSGPAAGELLVPLGRKVARVRSPGLLAITEALPTSLRPILHLDEVYVRPDGAGRLRIGSEAVDARLPLDGAAPDPELAQDLVDRAQAVLPVVRGARIEGVRLGWRPMPADGLSALGPVPGLAGYYLAFTHSGVTLGPVLGRMVCDEILTGQPRPELAPFRPDRLISRV